MLKPRVAIFASGGGTTFRATADAIAQGLVNYEIVLVITDRPKAGVLQQVQEVNKVYGWHIATEVINKKRFPDGPRARGQTRAEAGATIAALEEYRVDHLALMGCLRMIGPELIAAYGWQEKYRRSGDREGMYLARMSNTHPGILPATEDTFGTHTQQRVLDLKLDETAHSFHVVAEEADKGPLIAEHRLRVRKDDTPESLFARVQRIEKAHLPLDLDAFLHDQALSMAR